MHHGTETVIHRLPPILPTPSPRRIHSSFFLPLFPTFFFPFGGLVPFFHVCDYLDAPVLRFLFRLVSSPHFLPIRAFHCGRCSSLRPFFPPRSPNFFTFESTSYIFARVMTGYLFLPSRNGVSSTFYLPSLACFFRSTLRKCLFKRSEFYPADRTGAFPRGFANGDVCVPME